MKFAIVSSETARSSLCSAFVQQNCPGPGAEELESGGRLAVSPAARMRRRDEGAVDLAGCASSRGKMMTLRGVTVW